MIGVDLTYKLRSFFGSWFLGPKPLVQQVMAKVMKANPACHVFRERTVSGRDFSCNHRSLLCPILKPSWFFLAVLFFSADMMLYRTSRSFSMLRLFVCHFFVSLALSPDVRAQGLLTT